MLTRREFIQQTARVTTGATVVLVLTPLGCGDDDSGVVTSSTNPTSPGGCDGAASTSNVVLGHSHQICVPLADLLNPPANGATYVTTLSDGHTHNLVVDQGQLQAINLGQTTVITTTTTLDHQHMFSLARLVSTSPAPTPTQPPAGSSGSSSGGY